MTYRRVTRALHVALIVTATAALAGFVVLEAQLYSEIKAIHDDRLEVERQSAAAAHTLGIILQKAAIATDQTARLLTLEQSYWRKQNAQMTGLMVKLNGSADKFSQLIAHTDLSLNGSVLPGMASSTSSLKSDADALRDNLVTLNATTKDIRRQYVNNPDVTATVHNVRLITSDLHPILLTGQETNKHIEHMTEYADKKLTGKKTLWGKMKGGLLLTLRVAILVLKP